MWTPPLFRPWEPDLPPPGAFKTYSVSARRDTTVVAACEQAGCEAWQYGWTTLVDTGTDLGRAQADYIRHQSGRTFTETAGGGGLVEFRFERRQRCFREHRTNPESYAVRGGDWRAVTSEPYRHTRPVDWVDDFGEHQQRIADAQERG